MKITQDHFHQLWSIIHKQALRATTKRKKLSYEDFIENLSNDFPCKECKPHFIQLCKNNPLNKLNTVKYKGNDVTFFNWSFNIHNMVNLRLGKKLILFEEAYNIHTNDECDECYVKPTDIDEVIQFIDHKTKSHTYSQLETLKNSTY